MGKTALIVCITLILVVVSSAVVAPALAATEFVQAVTKPVYVLTLSPASATGEVYMDHELTATLTKDGVAVADQKVSWWKRGVGSWAGTPDASTDSDV